MLEQTLQDKIDVYIAPNYLEKSSGMIRLLERDCAGRSELKVGLCLDDVLCICDYDIKSKCGFLNDQKAAGLRKSVDHVILTRKMDQSWTVHLIEMKSGLGKGEWEEIRLKVRASILNIKALMAILDMPIEKIKVYTTYERISWKQADPTNPAERKAALGGDWKENEFDKGQIFIRVPKGITVFLEHQGIMMHSELIDNVDTLCGELEIS